jgi:hypothetical protein
MVVSECGGYVALLWQSGGWRLEHRPFQGRRLQIYGLNRLSFVTRFIRCSSQDVRHHTRLILFDTCLTYGIVFWFRSVQLRANERPVQIHAGLEGASHSVGCH